MKKSIIIFICCCTTGIFSYSQNPYEFTAEYQHGFGKNFNENSIGPRYEVYSNKSSWSLGINYTFSSLGSGKNAGKGNGVEVYAGYHYGLSYGISGDLFGGVRTSFTFGKDGEGNKYTLFTPSLETGYHYTTQDFKKGGVFTPFISLGYDVKVNSKESSKAAHEGPVFSPGISIGYRF
ncbi:MAG TPA: hypothetical protein VET23_01395 [Chitinophagaceae bacterium]|nr:hypothetical protein [Chitinophagaceae bacterium]